jgi:hypothetical protein
MPAKKEPRFFASDLDPGTERAGWFFVRTESAYHSLFEAGANAKMRGEATPFYLFSKAAAQRIRHCCGQAKIIIMIRDPIELMYSFHSQRLTNGNEEIVDFAEALAAEPDRREGRRIPRRNDIPQALQYRELATLSPQIERYLAIFERRSVFFVVFDDLVRDTPRVVDEVQRFLDVAPFTPDLKVHNPSKRVRSYFVRNLIHTPPESLRVVARFILPPVVRQKIKEGAHRLNLQVAKRPPMDPALERRLRIEFAPEVTRLSSIVRRDLSAWSATNR